MVDWKKAMEDHRKDQDRLKEVKRWASVHDETIEYIQNTPVVVYGLKDNPVGSFNTLTCTWCGAYVFNESEHKAWHEELSPEPEMTGKYKSFEEGVADLDENGMDVFSRKMEQIFENNITTNGLDYVGASRDTYRLMDEIYASKRPSVL